MMAWEGRGEGGLRDSFIVDFCHRMKKISGKGKLHLFDSLSLLGTINDPLDQWLVDWTLDWVIQDQAEARIIGICCETNNAPCHHKVNAWDDLQPWIWDTHKNAMLMKL